MPLYHIWFSTKRRKWLLQGQVGELAEDALREVAATDGIRLIECKAVIDHVHILVDADSSDLLPGIMKALKGKSAHRVFQRIPELKLDGRTKNLWQRGYAWKLVSRAAEPVIRRYIQTQMDRLERFAR